MRTAAFQRLNNVLGLDTPAPGFVGISRERARRSPARGFQRLQAPLGAARKPTTPLGVSHGEVRKPTAPPGVRHGEAGKSTTLPGLLHGEVRKPTTPLGLLHGEVRKPTAPPGLLHGEARKPTTTVAFARPRAFPAARPAGTARFLITREKASFYETATFGRRKVFFCSPFCGLLFCPTRAKLALPAGEKPAAPKPRPPRGGPAQRPRPAPGFCAASANARPGDPAPVRLLEKALWAPPTTEPFRPAPSGKPERERKTKGGTPDETRTAALTTAPPEDGWEGSQPKRPQRRGKPAKRPRRSAS